MGYYFEKARSLKGLSPEQKERYKALRAPGQLIPSELRVRIEAMKTYIGLITSGEIWSALDELVQDSIVNWILAGEDPAKVQWVNPDELVVPTPPSTEEDEQRADEWAKSFMKELEEQRARWKPQPTKTLLQRIVEFLGI